MYTVLLMCSVNTDFKLSALGPSGSFVWVGLYLFTTKPNRRLLAPWHRGYRMWCRKCHSPSDGKMIIFSTQQLQLNPTKSSKFQFRRSTAAIADILRALTRLHRKLTRPASQGLWARYSCTRSKRQWVLFLFLALLRVCQPIVCFVQFFSSKNFNHKFIFFLSIRHSMSNIKLPNFWPNFNEIP